MIRKMVNLIIQLEGFLLSLLSLSLNCKLVIDLNRIHFIKHLIMNQPRETNQWEDSIQTRSILILNNFKIIANLHYYNQVMILSKIC